MNFESKSEIEQLTFMAILKIKNTSSSMVLTQASNVNCIFTNERFVYDFCGVTKFLIVNWKLLLDLICSQFPPCE